MNSYKKFKKGDIIISKSNDYVYLITGIFNSLYILETARDICTTNNRKIRIGSKTSAPIEFIDAQYVISLKEILKKL